MDELSPTPDISRLPAPILLRAVLRAWGWSQRELAEKIGRTEFTVTSWLHGRTEPRLSEAQRLRALLDEAPTPVEAALNETRPPGHLESDL